MAPMRECTNCGAAMQEAQDWCVQCGAARKGRLPRMPGWLTGAGVLIGTALLVAGASVAAYAALSEHAHRAPAPLALRTPTVAQSTVPPVSGGTTATVPTGTTSKTPVLPSGAAPPKIPTQTPTPESSGGGQGGANPLFPPESKGSKSSKAGKGSGKGSKSSGSGSEGSGKGQGGEGGASKGAGTKGSGAESESGKESEPPTPILLDTNAASTYNPNAYPSSLLGDPSLAIDGEASTAWTAAVQSADAPRMAVGLVLDLRTAQKLASVKVRTTTPGITVEVFGANGHNLPATIADPTWKKLHGPRLLKKQSVTFKLKTKGAAYRFVLLWIVKAPPSSTPAAPGHVAIDELELFPPT